MAAASARVPGLWGRVARNNLYCLHHRDVVLLLLILRGYLPVSRGWKLEPPLHPPFLEQHLRHVPLTAVLMEFDLGHWLGVKIPRTEPGPTSADFDEALAVPNEHSHRALSISQRALCPGDSFLYGQSRLFYMVNPG